jgi:hypothetical protein
MYLLLVIIKIQFNWNSAVGKEEENGRSERSEDSAQRKGENG